MHKVLDRFLILHLKPRKIGFFVGLEGHETDMIDTCNQVCPARCICEETVVDCSNQGFREIPKDIPQYTTQL